MALVVVPYHSKVEVPSSALIISFTRINKEKKNTKFQTAIHDYNTGSGLLIKLSVDSRNEKDTSLV